MSVNNRIRAASIGHKMRQNRPGVHRRKLILVPQQNQPGARRERLQKLRHQHQADHRHLIDDHHVGGNRVFAMPCEEIARRAIAEQLMQRGCRHFVQRRIGLGGLQMTQSFAQRIAQSLGGPARRRRQGNARCRHAAAHQAAQQGQDDGCFAGARSAGDDREIVAQGGVDGALLVGVKPVPLIALHRVHNGRPIGAGGWPSRSQSRGQRILERQLGAQVFLKIEKEPPARFVQDDRFMIQVRAADQRGMSVALERCP